MPAWVQGGCASRADVSSKSSSQSSTSETIGCGLHNLGNTCFMNSVLQCLLHTQALNKYLRERKHSANCAKRKHHQQQGSSFCIGCQLEELVSRNFAKGAAASAPKQLAHALPLIARGFRLGRQEDAHELCSYLLEALSKSFAPLSTESRRIEGSGKWTLVQKWFAGALQSQIRCLGCGQESNTVDPFLDLSLELGGANGRCCSSVLSALQLFMKEEQLEGQNRYKCEKCAQLVRARKQFSLKTVPRYLTIHLKRFSFASGLGGYGGNSGKISSHIAFDLTWDAARFTAAYQRHASTAPPICYRLYALIVHEGASTHSGHYFAYVKAIGSSQWFLMNDSRVRPVSEGEVLAAHAYMLFYQLIGPVPEQPEARPQRSPAPTAQQSPRQTALASPAAHSGFIGPSLPSSLSPSSSCATERESSFIGPTLPPSAGLVLPQTHATQTHAAPRAAARLAASRTPLYAARSSGEETRERARHVSDGGSSGVSHGAGGQSDATQGRVTASTARADVGDRVGEEKGRHLNGHTVANGRESGCEDGRLNGCENGCSPRKTATSKPHHSIGVGASSSTGERSCRQDVHADERGWKRKRTEAPEETCGTKSACVTASCNSRLSASTGPEVTPDRGAAAAASTKHETGPAVSVNNGHCAVGHSACALSAAPDDDGESSSDECTLCAYSDDGSLCAMCRAKRRAEVARTPGEQQQHLPLTPQQLQPQHGPAAARAGVDQTHPQRSDLRIQTEPDARFSHEHVSERASQQQPHTQNRNEQHRQQPQQPQPTQPRPPQQLRSPPGRPLDAKCQRDAAHKELFAHLRVSGRPNCMPSREALLSAGKSELLRALESAFGSLVAAADSFGLSKRDLGKEAESCSRPAESDKAVTHSRKVAAGAAAIDAGLEAPAAGATETAAVAAPKAGAATSDATVRHSREELSSTVLTGSDSGTKSHACLFLLEQTSAHAPAREGPSFAQAADAAAPSAPVQLSAFAPAPIEAQSPIAAPSPASLAATSESAIAMVAAAATGAAAAAAAAAAATATATATATAAGAVGTFQMQLDVPEPVGVDSPLGRVAHSSRARTPSGDGLSDAARDSARCGAAGEADAQPSRASVLTSAEAGSAWAVELKQWMDSQPVEVVKQWAQYYASAGDMENAKMLGYTPPPGTQASPPAMTPPAATLPARSLSALSPKPPTPKVLRPTPPTTPPPAEVQYAHSWYASHQSRRPWTGHGAAAALPQLHSPYGYYHSYPGYMYPTSGPHTAWQ